MRPPRVLSALATLGLGVGLVSVAPAALGEPADSMTGNDAETDSSAEADASPDSASVPGAGGAEQGDAQGAMPEADAVEISPLALTADSIVAAGSFNSEVGCPGDWNNDCEAAELVLDEDSGLYIGEFDLDAGSYEYKISRGASWEDENVWGEFGQQPGDNIPFTTDGSTTYIVFDLATGWSVAGNRSALYTVRGSFQSQVGCDGDWNADTCLATVMYPQQSGDLAYRTDRIAAGAGSFKIGLGEGWGQSWPGDNYDFVLGEKEVATFVIDPSTKAVSFLQDNPPVAGTGQLRALWLTPDVIAWPTALSGADATYRLVGYPGIALTPGTLTEEQKDLDWRTKSGFMALNLTDINTGGPVTDDVVAEILRGGIQVDAYVGDDPAPVASTGAQIASVLDQLYPGAAEADLGVVWDGATPTLSLWAPTAENVALHLWTDADAAADAADEYGNYPGDAVVIQAERDDATGIWSVPGEASWLDAQYLWEVEVYVPSAGNVLTNLVTDPYSVGLTINSQRSVVVDLDDPRWEPQGWGEATPSALRNQAEQTIYELHVRDFSAWDTTVPEALRGTYKAFTLDGTDGVNHLRELSDAGLTTLHLLPTFDIATTTINELRSQQKLPVLDGVTMVPENDSLLAGLPGWGPASQLQQAAVAQVADSDAFNWGYDPFHWGTPEGSYATNGNQVGGDRTREYREMVEALHALDLRVVQDVVFNHTSASGQSDSSVLDRIVPGYYHRLNENGVVETSSCCSNIATEHAMAEKIMVDSIVLNATQYGIDGFRFDLMGHHSLENMVAIREALDSLTLADDGVDGSAIYLYGEGWDFGEVAGNRLFIQATQGNIAGTEIGTFNDRLRDAVRGGGPFDEDQRSEQGFGTGLYTDPNETALAMHSGEEGQAELLANLLHSTDLIRVGLAGSLKDFSFLTASGEIATGAEIDYNGQPAGYTASPQEAVNYVEAHDNETLFDNSIWKLPTDADMDTRVRAQVLANATVALGQSPAFFASGTELLRSKSLDRDSYNSGDWFNAIDWTGERTTFGTGLPVADKNQDKWGLMAPLLAEGANRPDAEAMAETNALTLDLLRLRASTPLFTLGDAEAIEASLTFPNAGPDATPGLLVMAIDDVTEVDPDLDGVIVVFNASPEPITEAIDDRAGQAYELSPVQAEGSDPVVKTATWDAATGTATVPAWTTAVFVAAGDGGGVVTPTTPPTAEPTPTEGPSTTTPPTTTAPPTTPGGGGGSGGGLPSTGATVGGLLIVALLLGGAGTVLVLRRRSAA